MPTYWKQVLVTHKVDVSAEGVAVNILGVFHGGQGWDAALRPDAANPRATLGG